MIFYVLQYIVVISLFDSFKLFPVSFWHDPHSFWYLPYLAVYCRLLCISRLSLRNRHFSEESDGKWLCPPFKLILLTWERFWALTEYRWGTKYRLPPSKILFLREKVGKSLQYLRMRGCLLYPECILYTPVQDWTNLDCKGPKVSMI